MTYEKRLHHNLLNNAKNDWFSLTVFFEEPFWVGVFEKAVEGRLSVCKVTFGNEPQDYELLAFIEKHFSDLKYSPTVDVQVQQEVHNPKRRQREVKKMMENIGVGTKSQQALKLQYELNKAERKASQREEKKQADIRAFELRQQKKKEKHKGK